MIQRAAVVIPILAVAPHRVIFVARAAHLRNHPGQIAFPGGTVDLADGDDLARTALRELHEELGIPPDRIALVGRLEHVLPGSGRFEIAPFVGVVEPHTKLTIDPSETAGVFEVPLAEIAAPGAVHQGTETVGERRVDTWLFDYEGMHVWGATGRILRHFVVALARSDSPLREALVARGLVW